MPIELGIWRLKGGAKRINMRSLDSEARLEDLLAEDLGILSPDLMLLGRQIQTAHGKFIDLLAIDREGGLVVIELKRNKTPREVVAQLLDYASWVQGLSYPDVAAIFEVKNKGRKLEEAFAEAFGEDPPDNINEGHELIVVASELDSTTERIIDYLGQTHGVPINAVFFRYFKDGDAEYLARTWLIDPGEAEAKTSRSASKKSREPWNGRDFYFALGDGESRAWEDCRKHGFLSAGNGKWYIQTMKNLLPGARVFVHIPKAGYVGVGIVREAEVPVSEFTVDVDGQTVPLLSASLVAPDMGHHSDDPEMCEHVVRVEWITTVSQDDAYWEKGLFASQVIVCKLRNQFTIERLTKHYQLED